MPSSTTNAIILPSLPPKLLLGFDTLALTPSPRFLGLKDIPAGWHFLYAGAEAWLSVRTGYWIHVPELNPAASPYLRIFKWSSNNEVLEPSESEQEVAYWSRRLLDENERELSQGLLPYNLDASAAIQATDADRQTTPPERVDFKPLTSYTTPALLAYVTGASSASWDDFFIFSTSASSPEDRDDIPGLSDAERKFSSGTAGAVLGEERELSFLGIDLKRTWRQGAVGRERTEDARDRSGALERVVEASTIWGNQQNFWRDKCWGSMVLGEMQVTFLMVLLLANWSCLEEWKRIIELVLTSKRLVPLQADFFSEVIKLLRLQLQRCNDVEGGLFDISGDGADFLKKHLREFRKAMHDLNNSAADDMNSDLNQVEQELTDLQEWLSIEWDWTLDSDEVLQRGMVQLEDGEKLEVQLDGFDADDETGEYAPVVVDLG